MLYQVFAKLHEIEEERNQVGSTGASSRNSLSAAGGAGSQFSYNQQNKNTSDFLVFKNTAQERGITTQYSSGKNYHIENSELLVKFIRFNNSLVRSTFEQHHFSVTESHEWNLLWSSCTCKSF
jgi:hypothetical protein